MIQKRCLTEVFFLAAASMLKPPQYWEAAGSGSDLSDCSLFRKYPRLPPVDNIDGGGSGFAGPRYGKVQGYRIIPGKIIIGYIPRKVVTGGERGI
jgi:hypothetical protein